MKQEVARYRRSGAVVASCVAVLGVTTAAHAQNVEPILQNGPDTSKKIVAVVGDGYAAADMAQYAADVQELVMDGVFTQDAVFRRNHTAFNVYRIDAVSNDSGVTQRVYDEHGTSSDASDDTIISQTNKDTALGYIYSGSWAHCWMQPGPSTQAKIDALLAATVPNYDYLFIILNEDSGGGCGGGGRIVVTNGGSWGTIAHEMGHGVGALHDEYWRSGKNWTSGLYNDRNCSTVTNRNMVSWGDLIDPATPVPTVYDASTMDSNQTVGIFQGCRTYETGIYRPVQSCRMRSSGQPFCPVCSRLIDDILEPFVDSPSDYMSFVNWPGATCKATGDSPLTYSSDATVRNDEATAVTLSCPGRRANVSGWANRVFAHAFVVDRHPTENVCCHVESKNPGGALVSGEAICSAGSDSGYQLLRLDFPKVHDGYTWSHFHVDCTLPGVSGSSASKLMTYRVIQQRY